MCTRSPFPSPSAVLQPPYPPPLPLLLPILCEQAVADFHSKHYSPNLMALAVTSRHSLDELEAMVRPRFEGLQDKGLKVKDLPTDVFLEVSKGVKELRCK